MEANRNTVIRIASIFVVGSISLLFLVPWYKDTVIGAPLQIGLPAEVFDSTPPGENNPTEIGLPTPNDHDHISLDNALTSSSSSTSLPNSLPTSTTISSPFQTKTSVLHVGQALEYTILTSPNDKYRFGLKSSGQLSLIDLQTKVELFTSNTKLHWPVNYHTELTPNGILELTWTNDTSVPGKGKPWTSALLPNCDAMDLGPDHNIPISSEEEADKAAIAPPVLELLDSGLLQIRSGENVVCTLHRAVDDPGRLAIIYAGFLRTYMKTCADHKKKLVEPWSGSGGVDVHVYSYLEEAFHEDSDASSAESIKKNLQDCFGDNLKTVTLVHVKEVGETWDNAPEAVIKNCGQATLDRHVSQYKSIWAAGKQVQKYMIQNGVRYNYILKTRLDLLLHGNIPELEGLVPIVADGTVVAPRVALDWNWYTMIHDGSLIAGVTDIMAFGKAATMWTYMNFYSGMKDMLIMEKSEEVNEDGTLRGDGNFAKWLSFNTHGHEKLDVNDKETCSPEDELAYWLSINDIPVQTDWRFEMGLLRNSGGGPRLGKELGEVIFTCPTQGRTWLCPGFVPEG